jgi:hypothetical protein
VGGDEDEGEGEGEEGEGEQGSVGNKQEEADQHEKLVASWPRPRPLRPLLP